MEQQGTLNNPCSVPHVLYLLDMELKGTSNFPCCVLQEPYIPAGGVPGNEQLPMLHPQRQ